MRFAALIVVALITNPRNAQDQVTGRLFSPIGTLLQKRGADKNWELPELYAPVHEGDTLLALPGARADLQFKEGDIRVSLRGNLPELSPEPVLESAIKLRKADDADVEFVLLRGRVVIENQNDKGPARARVLVQSGKEEHRIDFVLTDHTTVVALEIHRHRTTGEQASLLVLKGKAQVQIGGNTQVVKGPSLIEATLQPRPAIEGPLALKKPPDWATGVARPGAKTALAGVELLRRRLASEGGTLVLPKIIQDEDATARSIAVYSSGALDDLASVFKGLNDGRSGARQAAVTTLRAWSARDRDLDVQLSKYLLQQGYPPTQVEILLNLLRGVSAQDLRQPARCEALIQHLGHARLPIRELARWNLYLLVPQGQTIPFDAA